ncbi:hypothetical protein KEC55_31845 [Burkholderia cepacia]|uniref:hypothetical protein n=1 Tax=Burkholderia cepacia TaxID=292 RepID=UPI00249F8119|nr:hypothetical protein [Burkholderia cepacia]WGY73364.1 hypothetical protein KEC55_31845 [Burkholderia cepacia]
MAETVGDQGFDIPRRYFAAVVILIGVGNGLHRVIFPPASLGTAFGVNALAFAPWPIAVALCAPFAGRLANRLIATPRSNTGVLMFRVGIGLLMLLRAQPTVDDFPWCVALCDVGCGFILLAVLAILHEADSAVLEQRTLLDAMSKIAGRCRWFASAAPDPTAASPVRRMPAGDPS